MAYYDLLYSFISSLSLSLCMTNRNAIHSFFRSSYSQYVGIARPSITQTGVWTEPDKRLKFTALNEEIVADTEDLIQIYYQLGHLITP